MSFDAIFYLHCHGETDPGDEHTLTEQQIQTFESWMAWTDYKDGLPWHDSVMFDSSEVSKP